MLDGPDMLIRDFAYHRAIEVMHKICTVLPDVHGWRYDHNTVLTLIMRLDGVYVLAYDLPEFLIQRDLVCTHE